MRKLKMLFDVQFKYQSTFWQSIKKFKTLNEKRKTQTRFPLTSKMQQKRINKIKTKTKTKTKKMLENRKNYNAKCSKMYQLKNDIGRYAVSSMR